MAVKKALILTGGIGTRFLPLSKVVPKEIWPLVDKPIVHYLLEELKESEITKVIFVLAPGRKEILSYFKKAPRLEKFLKKMKKKEALLELNNLEEFQKKFSISSVIQPKPLGDGDAILKAKTKIKKEPFALLFCDDIVDAKKPAILQLLEVFKTCQKPIVGLAKVSKEEATALGMVAVEKIAHRLFKIKKVVEKPPLGKAPSDLAIIGRYILTPEIFDYLKNQKPGAGEEIVLAETLDTLLKDGKIIYGYELEGKWLRCGNKTDWLKSNMYFSLKHSYFKEELRKYL